jgi:8-oxo-dGTP pyrophosphatase MutT (NUDIX family)
MTIISSTSKYVGAGIILMRPDHDTFQFLLLKGRDTGVWSFSKGHPETCDGGAPLRTAVRETLEETGLEVGRDYDIIGNSIRYGKRPYWIGLVREEAGPVTLSSSEHTEAAWFYREEIEPLNSNSDVRAWIKKSQGPLSEFARIEAFITSLPSLPLPLPLPLPRLPHKPDTHSFSSTGHIVS